MVNQIFSRLEKEQYVLIAEVGVNYYDIAEQRSISSIEAAKLMIKEASDIGIHAVKFQSYKADTLASKESPYYWDIREEPTKTQYELFQKYDSFSGVEYEELAKYAEGLDIEFLSTPFDLASADYLEHLMNVYKISSSDLNNLPFITYLAKKNKPIILSVGASEKEEIERSVETIRLYNDKTLVLMHCVLEYPTPYMDANLRKIESLRRNFPDVIVGYSDHTKPDEGYGILKTAYSLGAQVIEKHFTLDKTIKGNDHYHAMDPKDAEQIIKGLDYIDCICGKGDIVCLESEKKARQNARRSIVAARNISKGSIITEEMITWKRPGTGITVDAWQSVLGRKTKQDIRNDTILLEEMLE